MRLLLLFAALGLLALAGCERLLGAAAGSEPQDGAKARINALQVAIEKRLSEPKHAAVCVLSIVDTGRSGEAAAEGAENSPPASRERVVRQELNNRLVANRFFKLIIPEPELIAKAGSQMLELNTAAVTPEFAVSIGSDPGAGYVVSALIDRKGSKVYLSVQETSSGTVIYQDTINEWKEVLEAGSEEEGAE